MLKAKKKKMQLFGLWVITLIVSSCQSSFLPKKPKINICIYYADDNQWTCTNEENDLSYRSNQEMDRSIGIPISDFAEYETWTDLLYDYAKQCESKRLYSE